jgi:glutamine transport system substrate-binding protein
MKAIAKEAKFEVEFVQAPLEKLLDGVGGDYPAAISALLVTDERAGKVAFSNDYQKIGLVLVIPSWNRAVWGIADVAGKKAGAIAGSRAEAEIKKVDPEALVTFQDYEAMFSALTAEQRTLDVGVVEYLPALSYMAKTPGVLKSSTAFTGEKLAIAVDKSRPELLAAVNAGLKSAQDNYLVKDVVNDWLAVAPDKRPADFVLNGGR